MALSKTQWSLIRKLKRLLQENARVREGIVDLTREQRELEQRKAGVEDSSPHEYDLLLALASKLHSVAVRMAEKEQQLRTICKGARFLGAELDRPENFPNNSPAFRVEEGVCCWAELYGLATLWISSAPSVRDRVTGAHITVGGPLPSCGLTPVHAWCLLDMASKKNSTTCRPQDRCPAAMLSILASLDSLARLSHNGPGVSAEQLGSRLLSLWNKSQSLSAAKKPLSGASYGGILSSDLSLSAFPDFTAQVDGLRPSNEGEGNFVRPTTEWGMDSCDSDGPFPPLPMDGLSRKDTMANLL